MNPIRTARNPLLAVVDLVRSLLAAVGAFFLLTTFVLQPFVVAQTSMSPTIEPREYLMIDKLTVGWDHYHRGDIVVFHQPATQTGDGTPYVKRVIGLPGDGVRLTADGHVAITPAGASEEIILDEPYIARDADGTPAPTLPEAADGNAEPRTEWSLGPGQYFVLGDNRARSVDSRRFGPVAAETIIGRAWFRYFPFWRAGTMDPPATLAQIDTPAADAPLSDYSAED